MSNLQIQKDELLTAIEGIMGQLNVSKKKDVDVNTIYKAEGINKINQVEYLTIKNKQVWFSFFNSEPEESDDVGYFKNFQDAKNFLFQKAFRKMKIAQINFEAAAKDIVNLKLV